MVRTSVENIVKFVTGRKRFGRAYMSNALDLSGVVFTPRRIESDRGRKRKWMHSAGSVVPEVTVNTSEGG